MGMLATGQFKKDRSRPALKQQHLISTMMDRTADNDEVVCVQISGEGFADGWVSDSTLRGQLFVQAHHVNRLCLI